MGGVVAKRLDQVVVVDVEATCWTEEPPPGQISEIIEIGVCTLDLASGLPVSGEGILVAPACSVVSEYCTQLTSLTQAEVEQGLPFDQACALLQRTYRTKNRVWASWGDYDRRQFERQCQSYAVDYPFGSRHLNVKTLFAMVAGLPHEVGMDEALRHLGMPLEGRHHRGVDDARNIARLLSLLLTQARTVLMGGTKDDLTPSG
jgi:inhibitor of KinA sporulation pathway (predicted exonuclease)